MSELRIIGKSVTVRFTRNGKPTDITTLKNFTFTPSQKILTEGYLGEGQNRQDEVFEEVAGSFSMVPESMEVLELQKMIVDRATRRQANDEQVSCTFRVQFPNGQAARISIKDMKFDPISFNVSGRDAYVEMSFSWKATGYQLSS